MLVGVIPEVDLPCVSFSSSDGLPASPLLETGPGEPIGCSPAVVQVKRGSSPCSCLPRATALGPNCLVPSLEGRLARLSCLPRLAAFREPRGYLLGLRPAN